MSLVPSPLLSLLTFFWLKCCFVLGVAFLWHNLVQIIQMIVHFWNLTLGCWVPFPLPQLRPEPEQGFLKFFSAVYVCRLSWSPRMSLGQLCGFEIYLIRMAIPPATFFEDGTFEYVKIETLSNGLWLFFKFHGKWITRSGFNSKRQTGKGLFLTMICPCFSFSISISLFYLDSHLIPYSRQLSRPEVGVIIVPHINIHSFLQHLHGALVYSVSPVYFIHSSGLLVLHSSIHLPSVCWPGIWVPAMC